MLVFKVLGEVHLEFWFMDGDLVSLWDRHHVHLLLLQLLGAHRSLPDADRNLMVRDGVSVLEWIDVQLVLVVHYHAPELPVGVCGIFVSERLLLLQDLSLLSSPLLSVLLQLFHLLHDVGSSPIFKKNKYCEKIVVIGDNYEADQLHLL